MQDKTNNMKAILKFDLTDPEDMVEFRRVNKSNELAAAIFHFKYNTVSRIKNTLYNELLSNDDLVDHIFEIFNNVLEEHDINIDELIS